MNENEYKFDPMTGEPIKQYEAPQYEAPQYEAPLQYEAPQQATAPEQGNNRVKGILSLVLGILSLVFCWFGAVYFVVALLTLGAAITGSIFGKNAPAPGKAGKIISVFGIVFSAICLVLGMFVAGL